MVSSSDTINRIDPTSPPIREISHKSQADKRHKKHDDPNQDKKKKEDIPHEEGVGEDVDRYV